MFWVPAHVYLFAAFFPSSSLRVRDGHRDEAKKYSVVHEKRTLDRSLSLTHTHHYSHTDYTHRCKDRVEKRTDLIGME